MIEYIGQRDEQQVGPRTRIHVKCRAGREDDQTAHDKGIQQNYADGFAGKPFFFADVTAEDCQSADTQTQRKERLAHGGEDDFVGSVFGEAAEIRLQEIGEAVFPAGQHDRIDG